MNIFVLDKDPIKAAKMQCDKHVIKMCLETAQMLCSIFENGTAPYRRTHYNHPCSKWIRESKDNYNWLIKHGKALCQEYTERYEKTHKSLKVIEWCEKQITNKDFFKFPKTGLTAFVQAMPDEYKHRDIVKAYRAYYKGEKAYMAKWKQNKPRWW